MTVKAEIKELHKACLADKRIQNSLKGIWAKKGWGKYPGLEIQKRKT